MHVERSTPFARWTLGLISSVIVLGFFPAYFRPLALGQPVGTPIGHVHGAVMFGWWAFVVVQATLAVRGSNGVRAHMRLGIAGVVLFFAAVTTSVLAVGFSEPGRGLVDALARRFDFWCFVLPTSAGLVLRGVPRWHGRLMLVGLLGASVPAWSRLHGSWANFVTVIDPGLSALVYVDVTLGFLFVVDLLKWRGRSVAYGASLVGAVALQMAGAR